MKNNNKNNNNKLFYVKTFDQNFQIALYYIYLFTLGKDYNI